MTERQTRQKQIVPKVLAKAGRPLTVPEILTLGQRSFAGARHRDHLSRDQTPAGGAARSSPSIFQATPCATK